MEQKANCEDLNFSEKTWQLLWAGRGWGWAGGLGEGDGIGWEDPKIQKNFLGIYGVLILPTQTLLSKY